MSVFLITRSYCAGTGQIRSPHIAGVLPTNLIEVLSGTILTVLHPHSEMDKIRIRGSPQGLLRSSASSTDSPLPPVSPEGKILVDAFIEQVKELALAEDYSVSKLEEDKLKMSFMKACTDVETLEYAIERLCQLSFIDRSMIPNIAASFNILWGYEVDSMKLRNLLLGRLQKDFENRHEIQAKSPEKFLCAVTLLGEIFALVRICGQPIGALSTPVMEYLKALLTGDDSEVELFAHLLIRVSPSLQEDTKEKRCPLLQEILLKVRSTLMSRNLSSQSRLWLLFVMDISSSGIFRKPSSSLQEFYTDKDNLGQQAQLLMKSIDLMVEVSAADVNPSSVLEESPSKSKNIMVTKQVSNLNISTQNFDNEFQGRNKTEPKQESSEKIRQPDKRENFRSALQAGSSKGKGEKNYWLHDDRFEKDETKDRSRDRVEGRIAKPRANDGNWRHPSTSTFGEGKHRTNDGSWRHPGSKDSKESPRAVTSNPSKYMHDLKPSHKIDIECEENWDD